MAATVLIKEMTASQSGYDKSSGNRSTTIRFKSVGATIVDTANRPRVPSSGSIYTCWKQLRLYASVGPSVDLQNLKAYVGTGGKGGAADFGQGVQTKFDSCASTVQTYITPASTNITGSNLWDRISTYPINLGAGLASTAWYSTGFKGKMLRLQLGIDEDASAGTLNATPLVFSYDET